MKAVFFCHAFTSCWNNGNAHFLRGVTRELARLGHQVIVCEPEDGWSRVNAMRDGGETVLHEAQSLLGFVQLYRYSASANLDGVLDEVLDEVLELADLVIVHEWNPPALIASIGARRAGGARFRLLFHDTHHRAVTAHDEFSDIDLDGYDGVLAFGEVLREIYVQRGWSRRAFSWHEAADVELYRPMPQVAKQHDIVWIGNWGDDERSAELAEFLIGPAQQLKLSGRVYGVRYPPQARQAIEASGLDFGGWLPNHRAPRAFAQARVTVHVPRGPYARQLPGIPTIRIFEALACGIPLVSAPWSDHEQLFPSGCYLRAGSRETMKASLAAVLRDDEFAASLSRNGLRVILERHTCRHRVQELLAILAEIDRSGPAWSVHSQQERIAS